MNKKVFLLVLLCGLVVFFPLFADGVPEGNAEEITKPTMQVEPVTVRLAVLKGPTGFGYVHLLGDGGKLGLGVTVEAEVLPSPTEVTAKLISGELDIAALPANLAANLYNKGIDIQLAAVTGEGMLYFLSRDQNLDFSQQTVELLMAENKFVHVPAPGSTPDLVTRYIMTGWGVEQVAQNNVLDFSITSPAQLAQMLIAGKIDYAVLPEPFASMAEMKSPDIYRTGDLQKPWFEMTGISSYPMTALVVQNKFAENNTNALGRILQAVEASISTVLEDPSGAAALIAQFGILSAELAEPAIPRCSLMYQSGAEARDSFEVYLQIMAGLNPDSIGGKLPDENFYAGNGY
ncbi:MAG: ABC transporter substrate-binding protein [Bacteroidetes bacterium]|nr:ABC transporter substrate-binding protein [Bacteroidota bacterium]